MPRNTAANIVRQMSNATTCGCLSYDIHARFAAHLCASTRVDSRGPVVDSVLIAGHAGTAAAVRGSAQGSALRGDRRCCALPGGKHAIGFPMSVDLSGEITAIATAVLAFFAIVTAIYAIRAFCKQSQEVRDQAEMLMVQSISWIYQYH